MEYVIEFILELLVDGTIEILPNKKVSKWIRYPLGILVGLFICRYNRYPRVWSPDPGRIDHSRDSDARPRDRITGMCHI